MMRLGCFAIVIALFLVFAGGQGIYETWNGSQVHAVTYAQFIKEKPSVGRYRITDGQWQLVDATVITSNLSPDGGPLYIPVRGPDGKATDKIEVLLHRVNDDEGMKMSRLTKLPEEQQGDAIDKDPSLNLVHKPVEGMVEAGVNSDNKDNDAVKGALQDRLDPSYVVLTEGGEPVGYLGSIAMLVGGLLMLGVAAAMGLRKGAGEAVDD